MTKFREHICGMDGLGFDCPACEAKDEARQNPNAGLSIAPDPLGMSMLLDDQLRERDLYHSIVYQIRKVLGEDGLHCQLHDLPTLIESKLKARA